LRAFIPAIAFMSGSSMNGPFFCERMLLCLPLHDELIRSFVVSRFVTEGGLSPWSHRVISLHAAFATAVRMVDGVHNDTSDRRTNPHVARPPSFSDRDSLVVKITDLADRRNAVDVHQSYFARRQLDVGVCSFFSNQLRGCAGAPRHLRTFAGTKFDVVYRGT